MRDKQMTEREWDQALTQIDMLQAERDQLRQENVRLRGLLNEFNDSGIKMAQERDQLRLALEEAKRHSGRCVDCKKWTCGFCGISNLTGEWRCYGCNGTDSMQLALQESQHRVKELEQRLAEECPLHQRRLKIIHQQQTIIQDLAEALRKSLRLGHFVLMSEETSSSHNHGPKRAAQYAEKAFALEQEIRAALANASPWLRKEGEKAGDVK